MSMVFACEQIYRKSPWLLWIRWCDKLSPYLSFQILLFNNIKSFWGNICWLWFHNKYTDYFSVHTPIVHVLISGASIQRKKRNKTHYFNIWIYILYTCFDVSIGFLAQRLKWTILKSFQLRVICVKFEQK